MSDIPFKRRRGQRKYAPAIDRFNAKWQLDPDSGCWNWTGHVRPSDGYTAFRDGRIQTAHRWIMEYTHGPIPAGMQVDHLCRNRKCVNPEHLEIVTPRTNVLRGNTFQAANAAKTHCPDGHPYSDENLYVYSDGRRACRICRRRYSAEFKAKARFLKARAA